MKSMIKNISKEQIILILLIMMCVAPMCVNKTMIGIYASHKNQYETLAESMTEGHIDLQYGAWDYTLFELDNVYSYEERTEKGVFCQWDHAFYDNHYYMYFGVIPVILLYLPFRMIFGVKLLGFVGTAVFTSLFILGVFRLFRLLQALFYSKMPDSTRLMMSVAFSLASTWYAMDNPALYCVAITSALCAGIWSIYFYVRAVWGNETEARSIQLAFWGAMFGAFTFGCRPTIALANLLAIPMVVVFIKKRGFSGRLLLRLLFVISPYVVIGLGLMYYNWIRFGTPFEFGQAYQLTVADQTAYGNMMDNISWSVIVGSLKENFFDWKGFIWNFPYVQFSGTFINYPIFLLATCLLFAPNIWRKLKKNQLVGFTIGLIAMPLLITVLDAIWVPWLTERYRMDFYWTIAILAFLVLGAWKQYKITEALCVYTMLTCVVLYVIPYEENLTGHSPFWLILLIMVAMTLWLLNLCRIAWKVGKNNG